MASSAAQTAPYRPTDQELGGIPTIIPDIPICAVFMVLYLMAGVRHQMLFFQSKGLGRKFGFCGMMSGLCWIRLVTLSLRIAWAIHSTNIKLGIAAAIFVNIGTVLLYFANLFFAQRVIRAQHPRFGWSKAFKPVVPVFLAILVLAVIMVIVVSVQSFYTLNPNTHRIDRDVQLFVLTTFAVVSFIPFLMVFTSTCVRHIPGNHGHVIDKFGAGSMRSKIYLLCSMSLLLATADSIKAGTSYLNPVPLTEPIPWYDSRGVFYGLGLAPEIIVLYVYAIFYVNLRFVVPDGADRPFSYAGGFTFAGEAGNEKTGFSNRDSTKHLAGSIRSFGRPESSSRRSIVSWGGISREMFEPSIGEDGVETVPYSGIDAGQDSIPPPLFNDDEQELGYNPKNGQWELRTLPGTTLDFGFSAAVGNSA